MIAEADPEICVGAFCARRSLATPVVSIEIEVRRDDLVDTWRRCGVTANYLGAFLAPGLDASSPTSITLSTVANELVENAVKYSLPTGPQLHLRCTLFEDRLLVETRHLCARDQADALVAWVERVEHGDAASFFVERLEVAGQRESSRSGLGLVALAKHYGGRLGVCVEATEDDAVVDVTVQVWVARDAISEAD